jgi:hypothetical protein
MLMHLNLLGRQIFGRTSKLTIYLIWKNINVERENKCICEYVAVSPFEELMR